MPITQCHMIHLVTGVVVTGAWDQLSTTFSLYYKVNVLLSSKFQTGQSVIDANQE